MCVWRGPACCFQGSPSPAALTVGLEGGGLRGAAWAPWLGTEEEAEGAGVRELGTHLGDRGLWLGGIGRARRGRWASGVGAGDTWNLSWGPSPNPCLWAGHGDGRGVGGRALCPWLWAGRADGVGDCGVGDWRAAVKLGAADGEHCPRLVGGALGSRKRRGEGKSGEGWRVWSGGAGRLRAPCWRAWVWGRQGVIAGLDWGPPGTCPRGPLRGQQARAAAGRRCPPPRRSQCGAASGGGAAPHPRQPGPPPP